MTEGIHYSKDLEAAVLGICMLEKDAFGRIYGVVTEKIFYVDDNRKVFSAMHSLFSSSLPIDLFTVCEKLQSEGVKLNGGNVPWCLSELTRCVVSSAHLEYHSYLIRKMWRKRELERLTMSGIDIMEDERKQAAEIQQQILELLGTDVKKDWYSMDELMYQLILHQQEIKEGKKQLVTTGFKAIDKMNGGFSEGQMIIIGARPSVGKSALLNKIAFAVAEKKGTVGIISLEMDNNQIAARLAAIDTETDFQVIYRNVFNDEREREVWYNKISEHTINYPIYVSDKTKVDLNEIRAKAYKLKHQHGLSLLIIDYLQLVESSEKNKNSNREQEVAKISRGLKLLAMEMKIPIVVLCQLNRASIGRKGDQRYPQPGDLRESGSLEQDADVIIMIHRDWLIGIEANEHGNSTEREADLIGAKWRNGSMFHLKLDFNGELMKFSERFGYTPLPAPLPTYSEPSDVEDVF
jgi:replicative DNA helicase